MKHLIASIALAALAVTACSDHFTTQEAYEVCEGLTERNPATNPPESFEDCVACYESCGEECQQLGTAPEDYACPDELSEDGAE